jgi:hypothetical protein
MTTVSVIEYGDHQFETNARGIDQLTWSEVLDLWMNSEEFCRKMIQEVVDHASALGWLGLTFQFAMTSTKQESFGIRWIRCDVLDGIPPAPSVFGEKAFAATKVNSFLQTPYSMIVCPCINFLSYSHWLPYLKYSLTTPKVKVLWSNIALIIRERLKENKMLWISSQGPGVPWMHFRIDENDDLIVKEFNDTQ